MWPWIRTLAPLLALALLLAACGDDPTPEAEPGPDADADVEESAWDRVQASGRLVFATAADYEPFVYYDEDFELQGFDVELARALGEQMGLEVAFEDMAFQGIPDAVFLGQADAGIGAIAVTPERAQRADFTNIYMVGEDAFAVAEGAEIGPFESYEELAPYRVGVQESSRYQEVIQQDLVDEGLMPAESLQAYGSLDEAVGELRGGRIDVVVADFLPLSRLDGIEMAARGLTQENYAIGLAPGSGRLRDALDDALAALQSDGTVVALAQEHLFLDPSELPAVPTPGPRPTSSAGEADDGCRNGMDFVEHLSYDDRNMTTPPTLQPGQELRKGWLVRNSGSCPWDEGYAFVYDEGNDPSASMGAERIPVEGSVAPGETYEVWADLVAPLSAGTYQAFWHMEDPEGGAFGERLSVGIRVEALPTLTPAPTQTPSAVIVFETDRQVVDEGESVTFGWSAQGAEQLYFYAQGQDWRNNPVSNPGARQVWPPHSSSYHLRVVFPRGAVTVREIPIEVIENETAPEIEHFLVNPPSQIALGSCATLEWQVTGDVSSVRILADGQTIWANAPSVSRMQHCPTATGSITYGVEATGPGGTSSRFQVLDVLPATGPTPAATPTPGSPPPQITTFAVIPNAIEAGSCVNITWSVYGTADRITIQRDGVVVLDYAERTGTAHECLNTPGAVTYRIVAQANDGRSASADAPVFVAETGSGTVPPGVPVILSFRLSASEIALGQCVNVSWNVQTPNLLGLQIRRDGSVVYDNPTPSGQITDCPTSAGTINYNLEARGEGGSSTSTQFLTVR